MPFQLDVQCAGASSFTLELRCELPMQGITAIYGPSGSGKTTLLDCIAGLREPSANSTIRFQSHVWHGPNQTIPIWQRCVGYVFQDARLFPHLCIEDNLRFGQHFNNTSADRRAYVIELLQLENLLHQLPEHLSAGQQQRVAIARALLSDPQVLLLDEPLANLDRKMRSHCIQALLTIAQKFQLPMLYVSHDIEEVCHIADHLLLLEHGKLLQQGPLLDLCSRLDSPLSQEAQAAAIVVANIGAQYESFGLTALELEGETLWVNQIHEPRGAALRVRIPARDVSLCRQRPADSSILNILPVTVTDIATVDLTRAILRLALGQQFLLASITRKSLQHLDLQVGDSVFAQIKSAALLMDNFSAQTPSDSTADQPSSLNHSSSIA